MKELQEQFILMKNDDMKRWEFYSKTNKHTSYLVSFTEADNETDAWICVGLAVMNNIVSRFGIAENN